MGEEPPFKTNVKERIALMLTKAKCPACGGALELNPGLERGICVYCGGEFLVQEAIQKFKAEVDGLPTLQNMLIRAEQKLSDEDFPGANALYEEILKGAPTCHEAWWGKFMMEDVPWFFRNFQENGRIGVIDRRDFESASCTYYPGVYMHIEDAKEEFKKAIEALDRMDLQYLFGKDRFSEALRAIEYAPEEMKVIYQQKFDKILEDCKRIAEEMKEVFVKYEKAKKAHEEARKKKLRTKFYIVVLCSLIGATVGATVEGVGGFVGGVILGVILVVVLLVLSDMFECFSGGYENISF